MKMKKKTFKVVLVAICILAAATLVSGALLSYFGKVTTTMNVQQSIVIGDEEHWYAWDEPIVRDLGDVVHCTDYCYKLLIKNQACKDAIVDIDDICIEAPYQDPTGIDICHWVFGDIQTVRLCQKNVVWEESPWTELEDGAWANVSFNTCGPNFEYSIEYHGLIDQMSYSLVYYANLPEYWDEGPVTILGTFIPDGTGTASGYSDVETIPYVYDENSQRSINDAPINENYVHDYGAKLWIVPSSSINGEDICFADADDFLFETDLVFYLDCSNWNPVPLPYVYPLFATTLLKAESSYCWISCYHVAFDIAPGVYMFETTVDADEVI